MWQPIETAPKSGYIVVATSWGSRWSFNQVWWNDQVDEWEDVHSDRYIRPHAWAALPTDDLRKPNPDA